MSPAQRVDILAVTWNYVIICLTVFFGSGKQYLGLQVDVSEGHLGHLVEAYGQRDSTEDEEAIIYCDPHQDNGLDISCRHFDQQGANQVDHKEEKTDCQEDQVQGKSGGQWGDFRKFWRQHGNILILLSCGGKLPVLEQGR